MKYFLTLLVVLFVGCRNQHKEIEIDPLSKSYILENVLNNSENGNNIIFFMYPEFCGMCTEEMVDFINGYSIKGYSKFVVLTQQNEITEKIKLPAQFIAIHDKNQLEKYGLGFATGHIFLVENECFIYSQIVNDETFAIVDYETEKLFEN